MFPPSGLEPLRIMLCIIKVLIIHLVPELAPRATPALFPSIHKYLSRFLLRKIREGVTENGGGRIHKTLALFFSSSACILG